MSHSCALGKGTLSTFFQAHRWRVGYCRETKWRWCMTALVHWKILNPETFGRQHKKPVQGLYKALHTWYIRVVHVANRMVTCHLPPVIGTSILPWPVVSASKASSLARQKTLSTVSLNLAFNRLLGHGAWSWSHRCGCSRSLQASSGHVWSCRKHRTKTMTLHKKSMQEIPRRWISRKLLCQTRGIEKKTFV